MRTICLKKGTLHVLGEFHFGVGAVPRKDEEIFFDFKTFYVSKVTWMLNNKEDQHLVLELGESLHTNAGIYKRSESETEKN